MSGSRGFVQRGGVGIRPALAVAGVAAALAIAPPPAAMGQAGGQPEAEVRIDKRSMLINPRFGVDVGFRLTISTTRVNDNLHYLAVDKIYRMLPGPPCFAAALRKAMCPGAAVRRVVVRMGPADDRLKLRGVIPKVRAAKGALANLVKAGAGDDVISGGRGDDRIEGGAGADRIVGGKGQDQLLGGPGADTIHSRDGERDVVDCGPGRDTVIRDRHDIVKNCEVVKGR